MASTPKSTLDDSLINGLVCAICGEDALHVVHMDNLPDFVSCERCNSAFLSEDGGERVFYGKIGEGYPMTERFALKQWVWLEVVEQRANEERGALEQETPTYDEPVEEAITTLAADIESPEAPISETATDTLESDEPIEEEITPPAADIEIPEAPIAETAADTLESAESADFLEKRLGELDLGSGAASIPGESDFEQEPADQISEGTDDLESYFRSITPDAETDLEPSVPEEVESPPIAGTWSEIGLEPADEQAPPEIADSQTEESISEPDDTWDQPLEVETPEADEIPLPDWAQHAEDSVDPSLEGDAQEIESPLDNLLPPEEPELDFLSDLRQSAGVPLESEPIPDLHISEVPLESQPILPPLAAPDAVGSAVDPESFAARIESFSQSPPTDLEPIEKPPSMPEATSQELDAADAEVVPDDEFVLLDTDPPSGHRFRVVIRGEKAIFPGGDCAHCGRTPAKGNLAVIGALPNGQSVGQRKTTTFKIPLCGECRKRAAQLSNKAKEARLQAHLLSAIGGMLLVVGALALDVINPRDLQIFDIAILAILFIIGYVAPVFFLLGRVGKYPPPASALYVRSTLLVPQETQGLETAFEWRNAEYANRFFEANEAHTLGKASKIKDRASQPRDLG
ncbi:MAG: hypothetical protein KAI06_04100 [Anaerolineales bacterium]|nr:hypothetical protein [Anaerolineales bacterium]